ncbi:hypothetical protein [Streptomyces sp. NPDC003077]|uniref:hypothetical protein n=1 Tax=Streptomyces sp. NPDC003077 TaxID=3154443 RepID=UPI0033A52E58
MRALVTAYGDLNRDAPAHPALTVLDLLRGYAHDCLHYGSYRSYQLSGGEVVRTHYGVNFRRGTGRSYSPPDATNSPTTHNLGTVMEGACDREARSLTRQAAALHGITARTGRGTTDRFAFRDVTGQLNAVDTAALGSASPEAGPDCAAYLAAMGRYETGVNTRYGAFLDEIGRAEATGLHATILHSVISGDTATLCAWLNRRHGPGAFTALFLARDSFGLPQPAA